ncbi:hypothetical protein SDC9_174559 [bioreactor metagenome]|uniref:Uncharacterized protein n=1 Tax=bioreactor metagenome TaxID=1076179 RepID=A0A645GMN3_9ZZZZ
MDDLDFPLAHNMRQLPDIAQRMAIPPRKNKHVSARLFHQRVCLFVRLVEADKVAAHPRGVHARKIVHHAVGDSVFAVPHGQHHEHTNRICHEITHFPSARRSLSALPVFRYS